MLITEKVLIKMNGKHISKYRDKGYVCEVNEIIEVDIKDVPFNSSVRVEAKCAICGSIKNTNYNSYYISVSNGGFYTCSQKCSNIKVKNTNLKKYGVDAPAKNKEIMNKMKKTSTERYGVDNPAKLDINTLKAKDTKLIKYGNENYNNRLKQKNTMMEKYGVDNASKLDFVKIKKSETCFRNHGVYYPAQNIHIYHKSFKHKKYKHLRYQSSYEYDFIIFCEENNIEIQDTSFNIDYNLLEKDRKYYPDFYLPKYNLICEVKSTYTFMKKYEENIKKKEYTLSKGYNFLFIVDKNYEEISSFLKLK